MGATDTMQKKQQVYFIKNISCEKLFLQFLFEKLC